ncbi:MAG: hypothetical protein QOE79_794 [Sphingomonadales bacterium]|nr:hypothetical protein [Sphingomonadales bacterium]MEA3050684.1 hypothetical protein [Sphingomonadales bacterium]
MRRIGIAMAATLLAGAGDASQESHLCARAEPAAQGLACAESGFGVALAPTRERAQELARLVGEGEGRFKRYFARDPAPYAVVEREAGTPVEGREQALSKAGFTRVLPWLSNQAFAQGGLESVRRAVEAGARAQGLTAGQTEAAVAQALAKFSPQLSRGGMNNLESGALPHETGHLWYIEAYWPGVHADGQSHYGGPGPDWMDEVSAILMEGGDLAENRRLQFQAVYQGRSTSRLADYPVADLIDLPTFLHRVHPGKALQERIAQGGLGRPVNGQPIVLRGPEAVSLGGRDAAIFYLQGRVFADFLVDRSGDPAIFASIGEAFGQGKTMEQWLAANGRAKGLADSIAELDRQWRAWLAARFGPPGGMRQPA